MASKHTKGQWLLKALALYPVYMVIDLLVTVIWHRAVGISDLITATLLFVSGVIGATVYKRDRTGRFGFGRATLLAIACGCSISGGAVLFAVVFRAIPIE